MPYICYTAVLAPKILQTALLMQLFKDCIWLTEGDRLRSIQL